MIVSNVVLSKLIDKEHTDKARISQKAFFVRVSKFYCPLMAKHGLCTRVCANCKPALLGSLEDILPRVRSVEAVVTWRLRGAVAIQVEMQSKAEKSPIVTRDEHGIRVAETGIDGLSALFGVV